MHMAEELPDVTVGTAIAEKRIVVEYDTLFSHTDGHLLGHLFKALHEALLDILHVVVPKDKINLSVKQGHDTVPAGGFPQAEITQMEYDAVLRYDFVPTPDELLIHFINISKGRPLKRMMFAWQKCVSEVNQRLSGSNL